MAHQRHGSGQLLRLPFTNSPRPRGQSRAPSSTLFFAHSRAAAALFPAGFRTPVQPGCKAPEPISHAARSRVIFFSGNNLVPATPTVSRKRKTSIVRGKPCHHNALPFTLFSPGRRSISKQVAQAAPRKCQIPLPTIGLPRVARFQPPQSIGYVLPNLFPPKLE